MAFVIPSPGRMPWISAYLDQPVVLYGHPGDLGNGYDLLAETASWLRGAGPTVWLALRDIGRTNALEQFDEPTGMLHLKVL